MNKFEEFEKNLKVFERKIIETSEEIDELIDKTEEIKSVKVGVDFTIACLIGFLGIFISNNRSLDIFLRCVHDGPEKYISKDHLLYPTLKKLNLFFKHKGDFIDIPEGSDGFISRMGEKVPIHAHRIRWGHDIFSLKEDNPFVLSTKQYGKLKGIFKALKHLTADTFSTQGLPIPFHSFLDYKDGNKLEDWINEIAKQSINVTDNKFSFVLKKMFSVNAQDLLATGFVVGASNLYIKFKPIDYPLLQNSFKLTSYTVTFLGSFAYGVLRYNVPFINWSLMPPMLKEIIKAFMLKKEVDKRINDRMQLIISNIEEIEKENQRLRNLVQFNGIKDEISKLDREFNFFSNL